jgi:hypothetical protein
VARRKVIFNSTAGLDAPGNNKVTSRCVDEVTFSG